MTTPLDRVLSGEFELCVPRGRIENAADPLPPPDMDRAFIRNALFDRHDRLRKFDVSEAEAREIIRHKCVVLGLQGSLFHYRTRAWPKQPQGGARD